MNFRDRLQQIQKDASAKPQGMQRFETWRGLLAECRRKPTKRRVHALRVVTLRLAAEVDQWLKGPGAGPIADHAGKRWSKQAEKLRYALSEVRETDVHLARLESLRPSLSEEAGYQPRSSRLCLRQIDVLQRKLRQERRSAAKQLTADIEARQGRLESVSREIESKIAAEPSTPSAAASKTVFREWETVAAEFPALKEEGLHDFRKHIKNVRYRAELLAADDAQIAKLGDTLKGMQNAIGEWHDWDALARLAERKLRGRNKDGGLSEMLATMTEESLQRALDFCESRIAQLHAMSNGDAQNSMNIPQKFPAEREELPAARTRRSA
ncbi:MAG: CHAD domain-containing protein [Terracidiphilus sp.]